MFRKHLIRGRSLGALIVGFFIAQSSLAANTSDVTATFIFDYDGAFANGNDETFNVKFDGLPEGSTDASFGNSTGTGTTSTSASQTMGGISLDDEVLLEDTLGRPYDVSFPDIHVDVNATATANNSGDTASTTRIEHTLLNFGYFGTEPSISLSFDFSIEWDMVLSTLQDGFPSGRLSGIAYMLDDINNTPATALNQFNVTPCPGCISGDIISLGNQTTGTVFSPDETSPFGGPVNTGSFTLHLPDTPTSSSFSVLIETEFTANASIDPIPVPAAVWLFGSALVGLLGATRQRRVV